MPDSASDGSGQANLLCKRRDTMFKFKHLLRSLGLGAPKSSARPALRRSGRLSLVELETRLAPAGVFSPVISTDQPDYAPGNTAIFTGTGFAIGEHVNISIVADNG